MRTMDLRASHSGRESVARRFSIDPLVWLIVLCKGVNDLMLIFLVIVECRQTEKQAATGQAGLSYMNSRWLICRGVRG